ncbi:MAG: hypothetical protein ABIH71_03370, partial [Candidatus Omnitrophota bacterium]
MNAGNNKKFKIINKILATIIIQSLLAGNGLSYSQKEINPQQEYLAPSLEVNNPEFQVKYQLFSRIKQVEKQGSISFTKKIAKNNLPQKKDKSNIKQSLIAKAGSFFAEAATAIARGLTVPQYVSNFFLNAGPDFMMCGPVSEDEAPQASELVPFWQGSDFESRHFFYRTIKGRKYFVLRKWLVMEKRWHEYTYPIAHGTNKLYVPEFDPGEFPETPTVVERIHDLLQSAYPANVIENSFSADGSMYFGLDEDNNLTVFKAQPDGGWDKEIAFSAKDYIKYTPQGEIDNIPGKMFSMETLNHTCAVINIKNKEAAAAKVEVVLTKDRILSIRQAGDGSVYILRDNDKVEIYRYEEESKSYKFTDTLSFKRSEHTEQKIVSL